MHSIKSKGLILSSINFQDFDRIITLFTEKMGLLKLIVKGANKLKNHRASFCLPLTLADFCFLSTKSELYRFQEAKLINPYFPIRNDFDRLQGASKIAHAILETQMPLQKAPELFRLAIAFLDEIVNSLDLNTLISGFYIKLLKYEGILSTPSTCSICNHTFIDKIKVFAGDALCSQHNSFGGISFSLSEWNSLKLLFNFRNFSEIKDLKIFVPHQKILDLKKERLQKI